MADNSYASSLQRFESFLVMGGYIGNEMKKKLKLRFENWLT